MPPRLRSLYPKVRWEKEFPGRQTSALVSASDYKVQFILDIADSDVRE